jgi:hypothetical protein
MVTRVKEVKIPLYQYPEYWKAKVIKKRGKNASLNTLMKFMMKKCPSVGEGLLMTMVCKWAKEMGNPYTTNVVYKTCRKIENVEKPDRDWLKQFTV